MISHTKLRCSNIINTNFLYSTYCCPPKPLEPQLWMPHYVQFHPLQLLNISPNIFGLICTHSGGVLDYRPTHFIFKRFCMWMSKPLYGSLSGGFTNHLCYLPFAVSHSVSSTDVGRDTQTVDVSWKCHCGRVWTRLQGNCKSETKQK